MSPEDVGPARVAILAVILSVGIVVGGIVAVAAPRLHLDLSGGPATSCQVDR